MTRRVHHEDNLQRQIARALGFLLAPEVVWWSNENRFNGKTEGGIRKARGCKAGVPDMTFLYDTRTVYVELKHGSGKATEVQRNMHAAIRAQGVPVAVCRSLDEVLDFLRENGFPVRVAEPEKAESAYA